MTNSIASAKCPSVLTSGNYGMSQNHCTDESKEYIFVKLTDSAHRAIEEYQRYENAKRFTANGQHSQPVCRPKIQIIGNSGVIHFPALDNSNGGGNGADGGRKFGFTIDDVEGSLECLRQTPSGLDVLGALSHRIRIHANDDIYDATRTKMAIAEETEKSKCIREIKPNQNDIGRKVKKPLSSSSLHQHHNGNNSNNSSSSNYLSNSNNRSKLTMSSLSGNSPPPLSGSTNGSKLSNSSSGTIRSPNPTLLGGSGTIANNSSSSSRYGSHTSSSSASSNLYSQSSNASSSLPSLTNASSLSSTLAGGISNGYATASTGSSPNAAADNPSAVSKSKMGSGNTNYAAGSTRGGGGPLAKGGSGSKAASSSNSNGGSKLPDIAKRKIRERLIHLLALKPFKKPELYSRLQNEGLRDRERALIGSILKDISVIARDNTYNIRRTVWNDVNENWPYYTEQELQQLKRRKPQNLTPPLSSDAGSSTSGQSPTSHTGSPPPLVGGNGSGLGDSGSSGLKRASLEHDDAMLLSGAQPKKQRISHFKKDALSSGTLGASSTGFMGSGAAQRSGGFPNGTSRNTGYSPHGGQNSNSGLQVVTDENSGNSDLSYNVLDNDDFVTHVDQSSSYYGNNTRKPSTGSNANNKLCNAKEKRNSGGSGSGSNNSTYNSQQERSSSKDLLRKGTSSPSVSRTPPSYNVNFVPESSKSGRNSANSQQRQSPSYSSSASSASSLQQHHKTNSVIFPSNNSNKVQASSRDETNCHRVSGSANRHAPSAAMGRVAKKMSPAMQLQQQQQQQQQQTQIHAHHNHAQQQQPQPQQQPPPYQSPTPPSPQQQEQQQQQQHNNLSPTLQIAAAVSSYATSSNAPNAEKPHYDFSNYTPITSIERRRQYKTEFERDFGEYGHLLARIENVGKHFRVLAEQLENARQGCPDYYNIKQQIVYEYQRISSEEELQRDKERFDYLHAKLAHIKQLVADYDKTLTSSAGAAAAVAAAAEQQRQHKQETETSRSNFRLSPMMVSGGESNNSPPSASYHHQRLQQQQEQHSHYQEHHDAETIELDHQQQNPITANFSTPPAQYPSPVVNNVAIQEQQSQYLRYNGQSMCDLEGENQRQQHHNNDSETDDSSDSNSDDDNEDDDDDDSNSNSNDDDDDDDNDHY